MSPDWEDPFKAAEDAADAVEREQGCICYHPENRGKIDKAQGQRFVPNINCPVHKWMFESNESRTPPTR